MGMLITMLYNALAGIMRAVGDTVAPLLFLVCAALLNVGLDLLFILEFHMGVRGAALATVLAQSVSVVLSFIYMWKRYPIFRLKPEDFKLSRTMVKVLFSSGLSMALMMSLVFFGTLALQCAINTFGTEIIVAHTAARKICEFYFLPISVMGVTMATFCGQNFGAGKFCRVKTGIRQALFITWGWTFVIILLSYTVAPS
ncbi:MAG: polysaccharide biosynthesis C-terminal domain-containing protein [Blautia marasmi]